MIRLLNKYKVGEPVIIKMSSTARERFGIVTDTTTLRGLVKVQWTYDQGKKTAEGWFKHKYLKKIK